jgi:hypothetical protein
MWQREGTYQNFDAACLRKIGAFLQQGLVFLPERYLLQVLLGHGA